MKHLMKYVAAIVLATTAAASAATYTVDGLINDSYDGFRSSLIHSQRYNGDMSGYTVAKFDEAVKPGGYWEKDGDIAFSGTLNKGYLAYHAYGNIDENGGGYLKFIFKSMYKSVAYVFKFDGDLNMGPANSYKDGVISLWGDTGTCSNVRRSRCYGMDLRIAVSPNEVPLPASALLLLGGVGAFAGLRRKKG